MDNLFFSLYFLMISKIQLVIQHHLHAWKTCNHQIMSISLFFL